MTKKTILALQPLLPNEMDILEDRYDVIRYWELEGQVGKLEERKRDIEAFVSSYNGGAVSGEFMDQFPNLKVIAQFGVGFDNIDVSAAQERGIQVSNTPDVLTDDTADVAIMLLMNVARRSVQADRFVREGRWAEGGFPLSTCVSKKTVGIYGMGKIGRAIAQRAAALNTSIIYCSRSAKDDIHFPYYENLVALAKASDFLVLACSGGDETRHVVNAEVLNSLGSKGYLINIARGSVVDEEALVAALKNGDIAGAGLDVFADEPNVPEDMLSMDNVVLSPHVGSATRETRSIMGQLVVDNLDAFFTGKPLLTPVH